MQLSRPGNNLAGDRGRCANGNFKTSNTDEHWDIHRQTHNQGEMVKSRKGGVNEVTVAVLHDIRAATS